jgi:hypothetical protein
MNPKPRYTLARRQHQWIVLEWTYTDKGAIGTKVTDHLPYDKARAELYRLNGWSVKPTVVKNPITNHLNGI